MKVLYRERIIGSYEYPYVAGKKIGGGGFWAVSEYKGKPIGRARAGILDENTVWLSYFKVNKAHRRRGVATRLMNELLDTVLNRKFDIKNLKGEVESEGGYRTMKKFGAKFYVRTGKGEEITYLTESETLERIKRGKDPLFNININELIRGN